MPPVLGPASPSRARLKSWAGARATARWPSQRASSDSSGPVMPSSTTTVGPASPKAPPAELGPHVGLGLGERRRVTRTPLPAASPSVFTTHGAGSAAEEGDGGVGLGRRRPCGRPSGRRRRPRPPSSTPSSPRAGPRRRRGRRPGGRRPAARSARPSTSGASGPMTERSASSALGARRRAGDAGGGHARRCPASPRRRRCGPGRSGEGVLPPTGADDDDLHCALQRDGLEPLGPDADVAHRHARPLSTGTARSRWRSWAAPRSVRASPISVCQPGSSS